MAGNVFTNAGAAIVTNRIIQAGTAPNYIGWGIGTTAAGVLDTALGSESAPTTAGGRTNGTASRVQTTLANDTYQVVGVVTATSTLAITEAGLFDAATAGNMLIHSVFAAINVISGDSVTFTFGLKFLPNLATNTLTNVATAVITNRMIQSGTNPGFVGWGTGTTAAAVLDTALQAEAAPTATSRGAGVSPTRQTTSVSLDTIQVVSTVTATSTLAITEAGLFDAATAGNLLIHAVFSAINVISGDSVTFTMSIRFVPQ